VKSFIQYFNVEKMGRFPNGADALLTRRMGVFTKSPAVQQSKGGTVFVIAGLGQPKRYYLWEAFTVEEVQFDGGQYTVAGPGWVLLPPQALKGKGFDEFKAACANFIGFRNIDDQPYRNTLRKLADKHRLADVTPACEGFCSELIKLLPGNGDAHYYRGLVRKQLGNADGAKEDLTKAVQLGTNFPNEAQAALAPPPAKTGKAAKKPAAGSIAAQVVSRGLYAQQGAKKPAGVSDTAWRSVLQRRGPEEFRQKLLKAYGGRCAVTGYDGEAALEVAPIDAADGAAPQEVPDALLLRADVRTLFELNLLRVHPRTKKVFVADVLRKGYYAKLAARQLRLPENKDDRPSYEALTRRWEAGGKA
jgi:hypothetical protein